MIQPDPDIIKAFAHVAQNVPRVGAYLASWYTHELERLPVTARDNQAVASGRCQVLKEINDLLRNAPTPGGTSNG